MKYPCWLIAIGLLWAAGSWERSAAAQSLQKEVTPLLEASCVGCHDSNTETGLNLQSLLAQVSTEGDNLVRAANFRSWVNVFDRLRAGEMPPESEQRPDPGQLKRALGALEKHLQAASLADQQRAGGRVPVRRLTKLELGYTLRDLLLIERDVTQGIPDEVESGSFDTVGATQRISAVHMQSYLEAADRALDLAINLGRKPYRRGVTDFAYLDEWHTKPLNLGGSITRKLRFGKGIALFADVDYLTIFQFGVPVPGTYRITARVAAYQSRTPVTAKFIVKDPTGGARLAKAHDLQPGEPETIVFDTYLQPGDIPYLSFDAGGVASFNGIFASGGARNYKGRGLAIMSQIIEGPLVASWPPPSSQQLLQGVKLVSASGAPDGPYTAEAPQDPLAQVTRIVTQFAPRVWRRPATEGELQPFIDLAKPALAEGRALLDAVRIPLRSMLSSPQFLLFTGKPGPLDDYALATRLSYFLWKSLPDEELFELARQGKLSDDGVLAGQVNRLLADDKAERFVRDFLGQWLLLHKVNATTPDEGLYPEYDEILAKSIPQEPQLFFSELLQENLSLRQLIDADFTFVNRRLAELYGIANVQGQHFRKVALPAGSPRGGMLTQAAILKTTANGTTTSPVTRGNFVLTNFLGTPPSPPPPGIGSIEPDTRGQTTIREILAAHRENETCNKCHRAIDPPGFALESFDPIGGFRTHYRASGGERSLGGFPVRNPPRQGPAVDPSGTTVDGQEFAGIEEFKQYLLAKKEQVARHFVSQLMVYATGGEIQFADRAEIEVILQRAQPADFPVRDLLHAVVQSKLFRHR